MASIRVQVKSILVKSNRRILVIDGGGIKGTFPAAFLASLEEAIGKPVSHYFDLIVGTSSGGILALGLGLGYSGRELRDFYLGLGEKIFGGIGWLRSLRQLIAAKQDSVKLKEAITEKFGDCTMGQSRNRLVIPAFNLDTGNLQVFKTRHHARFEYDHKRLAVEVAMATSAAPTYFSPYRSTWGARYIDGGVAANNPINIALIEAVGVLGWEIGALSILSLGCTKSPLDIRVGASWKTGAAFWSRKRLAEVFYAAQSSLALKGTEVLLPKTSAVYRYDPEVPPGRFKLDSVGELQALRGIGESAAQTALPELRSAFFQEPADPFVPVPR